MNELPILAHGRGHVVEDRGPSPHAQPHVDVFVLAPQKLVVLLLSFQSLHERGTLAQQRQTRSLRAR